MPCLLNTAPQLNLQIAHSRLPSRWPLYFFFGRFYAHVEASFILITGWDFESYRAHKLCRDFMEVQPKRTRVWPRLMYRYGMFMDHAFIAASAMPIAKMKIILEPQFWTWKNRVG
jgi:hypothetical protein